MSRCLSSILLSPGAWTLHMDPFYLEFSDPWNMQNLLQSNQHLWQNTRLQPPLCHINFGSRKSNFNSPGKGNENWKIFFLKTGFTKRSLVDDRGLFLSRSSCPIQNYLKQGANEKIFQYFWTDRWRTYKVPLDNNIVETHWWLSSNQMCQPYIFHLELANIASHYD